MTYTLQYTFRSSLPNFYCVFTPNFRFFFFFSTIRTQDSVSSTPHNKCARLPPLPSVRSKTGEDFGEGHLIMASSVVNAPSRPPCASSEQLSPPSLSPLHLTQHLNPNLPFPKIPPLSALTGHHCVLFHYQTLVNRVRQQLAIPFQQPPQAPPCFSSPRVRLQRPCSRLNSLPVFSTLLLQISLFAIVKLSLFPLTKYWHVILALSPLCIIRKEKEVWCFLISSLPLTSYRKLQVLFDSVKKQDYDDN